jgi:hypothetical protein
MAKTIDVVAKLAAPHLAAGETVHEAVRVNLAGTVAATAAGALGGAVGAVIADKAATPGRESATEAGFPTDRQQALAVTDQRILVFRRSALSGKPKDLVGEVPLAAVAGIEHQPGRMGDTLRFTMASGHQTQFECVKVDRGAEFAQAVAARIASPQP